MTGVSGYIYMNTGMEVLKEQQIGKSVSSVVLDKREKREKRPWKERGEKQEKRKG